MRLCHISRHASRRTTHRPASPTTSRLSTVIRTAVPTVGDWRIASGVSEATTLATSGMSMLRVEVKPANSGGTATVAADGLTGSNESRTTLTTAPQAPAHAIGTHNASAP